MLSERYRHDGEPVVSLNKTQECMKRQVERKIRKGEYSYVKASCCICDTEDFLPLSGKDRHGLYSPVVICRHCGLIQTNPRMTEKSHEEFYEGEYKTLYSGKREPETEFFDSEYSRAIDIYNLLKEQLAGEIVDSFVVEVGCGTGGILQYFREKHNSVYGVDLNTRSIQHGRLKHDLPVEKGTVDRVVETDIQPDLIIYSRTLEHVLHPVEDLTTLRSISHAGTHLFVDCPGVRNTSQYNGDFLKSLKNAHTYYFTLTTLTNVLGKSGWKSLYGNEDITSISIASSPPRKHYEDDHDRTLSFLKRLERSSSHHTTFRPS